MDARYFIHRHDAEALDTMKSIPGFTMVSKKFSDIFMERGAKIANLSSNLHLSERQLPEVYGMLPPICEKLEIPVPELYLAQDPVINAWTSGETTPYITLTSGLLNNCSSDVVRAVMAHECGHIVCKHVLYKTMVSFILTLGSSFLAMPFLTFALQYAMLYWDRCSEYSADRASAYVCGGPEDVVKTMTALASGSSELMEKIDREEFLAQAKEFREYSSASDWNKFLMYYSLLKTNHPFTADRAADIVAWCASKDYDDLCRGVPFTPPNAAVRICPKCKNVVTQGQAFCPSCGTKLVRCPHCGAVFAEGTNFCDKCGSKLKNKEEET
ncbi:MAG: M48 family metallopeptidase [Clostridia bacterium]|nr:M48 family metallopeptidase [Clostridia bacterium]